MTTPTAQAIAMRAMTVRDASSRVRAIVPTMAVEVTAATPGTCSSIAAATDAGSSPPRTRTSTDEITEAGSRSVYLLSPLLSELSMRTRAVSKSVYTALSRADPVGANWATTRRDWSKILKSPSSYTVTLLPTTTSMGPRRTSRSVSSIHGWTVKSLPGSKAMTW